MPQASIQDDLRIANSRFRGWTSRSSKSNQASICVCTLPAISDRGELTIEGPWYMVEHRENICYVLNYTTPKGVGFWEHDISTLFMYYLLPKGSSFKQCCRSRMISSLHSISFQGRTACWFKRVSAPLEFPAKLSICCCSLLSQSKRYKTKRAVLHYWLHFFLRRSFDVSCLRYTFTFITQQQTTVKLHGVYSSH